MKSKTIKLLQFIKYKFLKKDSKFQKEFYLKQHSNLKFFRYFPELHYFFFGWKEGLDPSPCVNTNLYLLNFPDCLRQDVCPLYHAFINNNKIENIDSIHSYDYYDNKQRELNKKTFTAYKNYIEKLVSNKIERKRLALKGVKVAFFTAIANDYEALMPPTFIYEDADYFLFTDSPQPSQNIWKIKKINYFNSDKTKIARFIKTHPNTLLSEYDVVIWMDANLAINGDIRDLVVKFIESNVDLWFFKHPIRDSFLEEGLQCLREKKISFSLFEEMHEKYKINENCLNNDLIESNFYFCKNKNTKFFFDKWWNEIFLTSRRDQLSLNYALFTSKSNWDFFPNTLPNARETSILVMNLLHGKNNVPRFLSLYRDNSLNNPFAGNKFKYTDEQIVTVDIIVCVYNAIQVTMDCLNSIVRTRNLKRDRIIIVDDFSNNETYRELKEFSKKNSNVILLRNECNKGYTKSVNIGISASDSDVKIILNSDTIVTEDWIDKFLYVLSTKHNVGVVGPLSNAASLQSVPSVANKGNNTAINDLPVGVTPDFINKFLTDNIPSHTLIISPLIHGFCMAFKKDIVTKVGLFDEVKFPFGYGEENDFCLRVFLAGFQNYIIPWSYIYHIKSQSFPTEKRMQLMKEGHKQLEISYGTRTINNCVKSLSENPDLSRIRNLIQQSIY